MFQQMKKRIKNEKGLTLIELLAVIVILAIIAAIAIPAIGNIIDSSRVKAAKADAANVLSASQLYFTENTSATKFSGTKPAEGAKTGGEANADDWTSYITDLGTIETFNVTKEDGVVKVDTTGVSGGKPYTIAPSTLSELNIDSGKVAPPFSWDGIKDDTK